MHVKHRMRNEGMISDKKTWKVGELAKLTGITVRTLHHYDQCGLLSPSLYTDAGHRLYTKEDIARLQQIMSLKQLGFSLDGIKQLLENPDYDPTHAIRMQLERLNEQIRIQQDLRSRLEELLDTLSAKQDVTAEKLIKIVEVMRMTQDYFTSEQMEKIKQQGELLGSEKIKAVQNEWSVLIAKVRVNLDKGTPSSDPAVVELAKRWRELVRMFSGGDSAIEQSLEHFYHENPNQAAEYGIDGKLFRYVKEAMSNI
ncbi:MerR family transcriptional regulator [Alicyclobacillus suci]|uniref:MerR family transcriptional regulator n=1 Tax=Alicyclobacillus suci TaxID=2816080 RepID=UPI001F1DD364|nr:MerR family transcriptional regulator [Alicyclobacillus suci]